MAEVKNADQIRLSPEIAEFLKEKINSLDPDARIFLFGSRADINKKGGDIDLMILSDSKLDTVQLAQIKRHFWEQFGMQKLDLVNFTFEENPPFKRLILPEAIEL